MKLFKRGPLSAVLWSFAAAMAAYGAAATIDPGLYLDDIKFLASQDMKGRGTGTPELEKAAAFIAADFRSFGLQPIDGKSYYRKAFYPGTSNRSEAATVTLGAGETVDNLNFYLPPDSPAPARSSRTFGRS